jgi:hypothetical protein
MASVGQCPRRGELLAQMEMGSIIFEEMPHSWDLFASPYISSLAIIHAQLFFDC